MWATQSTCPLQMLFSRLSDLTGMFVDILQLLRQQSLGSLCFILMFFDLCRTRKTTHACVCSHINEMPWVSFPSHVFGGLGTPDLRSSTYPTDGIRFLCTPGIVWRMPCMSTKSCLANWIPTRTFGPESRPCMRGPSRWSLDVDRIVIPSHAWLSVCGRFNVCDSISMLGESVCVCARASFTRG